MNKEKMREELGLALRLGNANYKNKHIRRVLALLEPEQEPCPTCKGRGRLMPKRIGPMEFIPCPKCQEPEQAGESEFVRELREQHNFIKYDLRFREGHSPHRLYNITEYTQKIERLCDRLEASVDNKSLKYCEIHKTLYIRTMPCPLCLQAKLEEAEKELRKQLEINQGKPPLRDGVSPQMWCETYDKCQQQTERIKHLKHFEEYSYYVGTEITCERIPMKYSRWLDFLKGGE